MNAYAAVAAVLAWLPTETTVSPWWWEIVKGFLLFAITGCAGFIAKGFWGMSKMVVDHERQIYGRDGENGLIRGHKSLTTRVKLIEDRNTAIDAVTEAEQADYRGPERRHAALHKIVEMVASEFRREKEERERSGRTDE